MSVLTPDDLWLFNEGAHTRLYQRLGAHPGLGPNGEPGCSFGVWAPNARQVSVVGDFNAWRPGVDLLDPQESSGIWNGFVAGVAEGDCYKYHVESRANGYVVDKTDPVGFASEMPPRTASKVVELDGYEWGDSEWMATRGRRNALDAPMSVYELHLGSWRHAADEHRSLNYRELAPVLAEYVLEQGFTHVEFMPLTEHPFYGSWGYQTTGYFAPTARFGSPHDLMYLIDVLHRSGIGVILDWVPSHFPTDEHGLGYFDGTHLYEHADPRKGFHPDWNSAIFNYDRFEVRSFLLSSAHFWLDRYHVDGIRVDAVASMLYLDYSREDGEWIPNEHGGNENLGALRFLKKLNETVYADFPDVQTIAEESTAWPMVSRPLEYGGLGFGLKWDMGWMHDTLAYFEREPIHREYHQGELTFRMVYAFTENFVLPLSHDEVVHGKGSLLAKMPGDEWQRMANLRALYGYQYAQPGKKLLFMGAELAQESEWDHDSPLPWWLLDRPAHAGVQAWVRHLNLLHRREPALHEVDIEPAGFQWVDASDTAASVQSFLRHPRRDAEGRPSTEGAREVLCVSNLTPVPREGYRVGVPRPGRWTELANSDDVAYGGSGVGNHGGVEATADPAHGFGWSVPLALPPLGVVFLAPEVE
ncbi:1,4-alpha-glucan branching protein GlgB [Rhabdothermincola salaria]|uniref:1,4-alpha-glucan branching protein GlgB n=1 Tax=Rhabdothermincola salaria TaxID=2903142 RepID=UPI001E34E80E|nr:1,4-alpha-glucan branching protein GlgB [Rhabdothermincola salaria]MCD9623520.1 1,4-alpha-glucan branching protein GlgB [Rhabdothermincola salaria]